MLRAIILSLVLFLAIGTIVPFATQFSEAGSRAQKQRKYKKKKRAKKYRRYRSKYRRTRKKRRVRRYRKSRRYSAKRRTRKKRRVRRYRKSRRYSAKRRTRKKRRVRRYKKSRKYRAKRRTRKKRRVRKYRSKRKYTAKRRVRKKRRVRRHSAAWWRQYRKRQARKKAIARRKRSLRLRRIRLAKKRKSSRRNYRASSVKTRQVSAPAVLPTGDQAPMGWVKGGISNGELQYKVAGDNGSQIGSVSLSDVGPAMGKSTSGWRNKTVGGVSVTALRRTVIDRMIQENGWVENDYEKEIDGKKVYVVVAKSADRNNQVQARTFYFTEANGRIYSVATKSGKDSSKQIVQQSEKVIKSLSKSGEKVQQAKKQ